VACNAAGSIIIRLMVPCREQLFGMVRLLASLMGLTFIALNQLPNLYIEGIYQMWWVDAVLNAGFVRSAIN